MEDKNKKLPEKKDSKVNGQSKKKGTTTAIDPEAKKPLPKMAIIIGAIAATAIVATILLIALLGGNKCKRHIDEDTDSKCDLCGEIVVVEEIVLSPSEFKVKVLTEGGMPVKDVMVYVHKSDKEFDVAGRPLATDDDGIAAFSLDEGQKYSVQLEGLHDRYVVPAGDAAHGRYVVKNEELVITLAYNPEYKPSVYTVGDKIPNYKLSDVDGNEYTLYSLLESKDMVMLNFWFVGCAPCRAEFPAINAAYKNYQSDIEILAINNTDSAAAIKAFPTNYDISIDFPLLSVRPGLNSGYFGSNSAPTTVIIDRYGVVCLVEVGSIPSMDTWNSIFAYFTADNYTQRLFTSVSGITGMN